MHYTSPPHPSPLPSDGRGCSRLSKKIPKYLGVAVPAGFAALTLWWRRWFIDGRTADAAQARHNRRAAPAGLLCHGRPACSVRVLSGGGPAGERFPAEHSRRGALQRAEFLWRAAGHARPDWAFLPARARNTIHGRQSLDPARRHEPLSYYYRAGPWAPCSPSTITGPPAPTWP